MDLVGISLKIARRLPVLNKMMRMINRVVLSCDIPPETDIHESVFFAHHGLGVVVNKNSSIGKNTRILQNVTIGGTGKTRVYKGKEIIAPIIGENVKINSGVQIIGPIVVGDNAVIGAGSIVVDDVPPSSVVVGQKAGVIKYL